MKNKFLSIHEKNSRHEISSTTNITQMQNLGTFLYKMKCRKCKNHVEITVQSS